MTSQNKLLSLLNIQPGEGKLVSLLLAHSFFVGMTLIILYTAVSAIFLGEFESNLLPFIYILSALVVSVVSYVYSKIAERFPANRVLIGTLLFLLLLLGSIYIGLQLFNARWLIFSALIWFRVIEIPLYLEFWGLATRLFTVREGKRLFGLIGSGEFAAKFLGGFMVAVVVQWIGTLNLLLIAGGGLALSLVVLVAIIRYAPQRLAEAPETPGAETKTKTPAAKISLLQNRYLLLIFFLFVVSIAGNYFIDFLLFNQTQARFQSQDEIARFFGFFIGLIQLITFLVSTLLSGRLISRYGISFGLWMLPMLFTAAMALVVVTGSLTGPGNLFFWLVVLAKLLEEVLRNAVERPTLRVLFTPFRSAQRLAAQGVAEGRATPIGAGVAGTILLIFTWLGSDNVIPLTYVMLVFFILWIILAIRVYREYSIALIQALAKRQLSNVGNLTADPATVAILRQGLDSPRVGAVLYALDRLEELEPEPYPQMLQDLLGHPELDVRLDVLRRIERLGLVSAVPAIRDRLKYESSPAVRGASLRVLATLGGLEVIDVITTYLEDPDPHLSQGAMIGLLRSGELEGIMAAGEKLLTGVNSSNPSEREFAAYILGESGLSGFYRPLLKLIHDDRPQVQRAALVAAGKLKHPNLWPAVVDALAWPQVRALAASTLVGGGQDVLPALQTAVNQNGRSAEVMSLVARICGRIGGKQAIKLLYKQITYPDERVRTQILLALSRCGYQAGDNEAKAFVEQQIQAEIAQATWLLGAQVRLREAEPDGRPGDVIALLNAALENSLARHRLRLFEWLSFIYDPASVLRVRDILSPPEASLTHKVSDQQRAYALEVIDVLLPSQQKELILSLVRNLTPNQRLQRLTPHFSQPDLSRNQYLEAIISGSPVWFSPWSKVCALYEVERLGLVELTEAVVAALSAPEAAVRETAVWALAQLDMALYHQHAAALANDPNPLVVRTIKHTAETGEHAMLSTVEKVILLKSLDFFAETSEEVLLETASILEEVEVSSGETFLEKGKVGNSLYLLIEGQVRVHDGEQTVAELSQGDVIGELALLDPAPRSASVTAVTETRLFRLGQAPFFELLEDRPEVARKMLQVMARRLRRSSGHRKTDRTREALLDGLTERLDKKM